MSYGTVAVVIVNWNGLQDTLACLESLKLLDYEDHVAVVVDNGSRAPEGEAIRKAYPDAVVIEAGENLGFAGGCNVGVRYAIERRIPYVFLLNNDAVVCQPTMLTRLMDLLHSAPDVGAVGPKVVYDDKPDEIWFAGGTVVPSRGMMRQDDVNRPADSVRGVRPTDFVTGCACLSRTSLYEEVGLIEEGYFLFFEDTDWSLQVKRAGKRLLMDNDAVLRHKCGRSMKRARDVDHYYFIRARLRFARRFAPVAFWFNALPRVLWEAVDSMVYNTIKRRPHLVRRTALGVWDGLRGRTGIRHR